VSGLRPSREPDGEAAPLDADRLPGVPPARRDDVGREAPPEAHRTAAVTAAEVADRLRAMKANHPKVQVLRITRAEAEALVRDLLGDRP